MIEMTSYKKGGRAEDGEVEGVKVNHKGKAIKINIPCTLISKKKEKLKYRGGRGSRRRVKCWKLDTLEFLFFIQGVT